VSAASLNGLLAVEFDFVRLEPLHRVTVSAERLAEIRLSAAIDLCPRLEVAEALMCGVSIPAIAPTLVGCSRRRSSGRSRFAADEPGRTEMRAPRGARITAIPC